jgi:hypothetical protein
MFAADNRSPPALKRLIVRLGRANDLLANRMANRTAKLAGKLARKDLSPARAAAMLAEVGQIVPGTHASFDARAEAALADLRRALAAPDLAAPAFHDLRKSLKLFINVTRFLREVDPDPGIRQNFDHLYAISQDLGAVHDALLRRALRHELDYQQARLQVPEQLRQPLLTFIGSYQNRPAAGAP